MLPFLIWRNSCKSVTIIILPWQTHSKTMAKTSSKHYIKKYLLPTFRNKTLFIFFHFLHMLFFIQTSSMCTSTLKKKEERTKKKKTKPLNFFGSMLDAVHYVWNAYISVLALFIGIACTLAHIFCRTEPNQSEIQQYPIRWYMRCGVCHSVFLSVCLLVAMLLRSGLVTWWPDVLKWCAKVVHSQFDGFEYILKHPIIWNPLCTLFESLKNGIVSVVFYNSYKVRYTYSNQPPHCVCHLMCLLNFQF